MIAVHILAIGWLMRAQIFSLDSALLRIREAGFTETERQAVLGENAQGVLAA
jgi:hypothetical protein